MTDSVSSAIPLLTNMTWTLEGFDTDGDGSIDQNAVGVSGSSYLIVYDTSWGAVRTYTKKCPHWGRVGVITEITCFTVRVTITASIAWKGSPINETFTRDLTVCDDCP